MWIFPLSLSLQAQRCRNDHAKQQGWTHASCCPWHPDTAVHEVQNQPVQRMCLATSWMRHVWHSDHGSACNMVTKQSCHPLLQPRHARGEPVVWQAMSGSDPHEQCTEAMPAELSGCRGDKAGAPGGRGARGDKAAGEAAAEAAEAEPRAVWEGEAMAERWPRLRRGGASLISRTKAPTSASLELPATPSVVSDLHTLSSCCEHETTSRAAGKWVTCDLCWGQRGRVKRGDAG